MEVGPVVMVSPLITLRVIWTDISPVLQANSQTGGTGPGVCVAIEFPSHRAAIGSWQCRQSSIAWHKPQ